MSTLKVNKLRDTAGSADAITLDPNGGAVLAGVTTVSTVKVGSGVTITSDGDIFHTGVCTATSFVGDAANLTKIPAANIVGVCTSGLTKTGGFSPIFAEAVVSGGSGSPSVTRSTGFGSLTDNGTGDFTLALSTAQSDANYTVVGATGFTGNGVDASVFVVERIGSNGYERANTTTAVNFGTVNDSLDARDVAGNIHIACMRG